MDPTDLAKDIVRLGTTYALGKDVIDLLNEKSALLVEKITVLQEKNELLTVALEQSEAKGAQLRLENANLKFEIQNLKAKLQGVIPEDGLPPGSFQILCHAFDAGREVSLETIAKQFGLQPSVAEYYYDELRSRELAERTRMGFGRGAASDHNWIAITRTGRAYVMKRRGGG